MAGPSLERDVAVPAARPAPRAVQHLLGVDLDAITMAEAVSVCERAIREQRPLTLGAVNAAKIVKIRSDAGLRESIASADVVLADGMSVVWASRILGRPLPERVTGIDLFRALLEAANQSGYSVYFLGATREVVDEVVARVRARYPGLRVAGARDGYFADEEAEAVARGVAQAEPDLLFVAMTTPKKELFLERFGHCLGAHVRHGVGGSFDVMAGKVERAPELWQRLGLEWLYRVVQEPGRLWRRYLVTNTLFISMVAGEWLRLRLARRDLRP